MAGLVNEPAPHNSANLLPTHFCIDLDGTQVQLVVYYTVRAIEAEEELLIHYGSKGPRGKDEQRGQEPPHSSSMTEAEVEEALDHFCVQLSTTMSTTITAEALACTYGAVDSAGEGASQSDEWVMEVILERNRRAREK